MNKEEAKQEKEFWVQTCLKGSGQVRSWLGLNETSHQMVAGYSHQDTREFFIYSVLNEIEKAGTILMNYKEFFEDTGEGKELDEKLQRVEKMILNAINEDLSLWQRKLSELLLDLIGFTQNNNLETYRHYLLISDLEGISKQNGVLEEYYDCNNQNIKSQIVQIHSDIVQLETTHPHLRTTHYSFRDKKGKLQSVDYRKKLNQLLTICKPAQKIVLGLSYEKYANLSGLIHSNPDSIDRFINIKALEKSYASIGLLSMHCLLLCQQLLKKKPRKGTMSEVSKMFKQNKYPDQLLRSATLKNRIKKNDIVIAADDLAEVVEVKRSKFGYISYKIRYLSKPPIPTITEDELPYYYVRLYADREFIRKKVVEEISKHSGGKKPSNKLVADSIRKSMTDFWENLGGKELFWGRKDLAHKKLSEHLAKSKVK